MKILIALSRFPYPIDKGDKLRAYFQIKGLSKNHEIYLVCLAEQQPSDTAIRELNQYCKKIIIIPHSKSSKLFNLFSGLFNSFPFQTNYFKSKKMKKIIYGLIVEEKIDVCYVQLIRLIKNIPFGLKTNYYLDYMDAFSKGMKNRYPVSTWFEKPFVKMEAKRLSDIEIKSSHWFDGYSIICDADAEAFPTEIKNNLDIIPNGVNESFFSVNYNDFKDKEFDIIFTGNMGYHPNVQACKYIVLKLLAILKSKGYDVKICLAGVNPSPEVLALKSENVTVTGYVEDLKEYLSKAKIFAAPLFSGSGLQNKLLEAMAAGIPVITTSLANQALKASNREEIIVSDEIHNFAEEIINLLQNEQKSKVLGQKGRDFILKNYHWNNCNLMLEKALNSFKRV